MKSQPYDRLHNMTSKLMDDISSRLIYNNDIGQYVLFDEYFLEKVQTHYQVSRHSNNEITMFNSLRNATTWSILDKYNKIIEARRVIEIDKLMAGIKIEIMIHKKSNSSQEDKEIKRDKLLHDLNKQKRFQWELDKYITLAKTCQERGFKNELTRTS